MTALGSHGVNLPLVLYQKNLGTIDALDLKLLLLLALQVQRGQALELEFLSHSEQACCEGCLAYG